ncbi:MAG: HAMP domain-containing protein [Anaerolineales bacterium]|nr:HAMP domain-containing protein [Anaerolineales bacterium]
MRRLWVQLTIAFSSVILISAVMLFVITVSYGERQRQAERDELRDTLRENILYGERGVVTQLEGYFADGGTLDGAAALLIEMERIQPPQPVRVDLQLLSPQGVVVFGRIPPNVDYEDVALEKATLRYSIDLPPNEADTLYSPPTPRPEDMLVILVVIGTIMGIVVSMMMGRRLAAPLSQLAQIARQVGGRDFSLRVEPKGSEETRDLAHAFNDMATMLQQSEQLRNNLIADVAHELRTPLTVMESSLRALIDDIYPLTKTEILTLYDQTRHLSRMVNDLHELSLADARELSLERHTVELTDLLHSLAEIFKPVAEAEDIRFVIDTPATPLNIGGDRGRLVQVVQNLLVNALRHTPANGQITLRACQQAEHAIINIEDTGEGIASEHIAHVFERFYRTDRARDRSKGGAGLGLAIGKAIIQAHGGQIDVTSRTTPPTGTCFTITLPLTKD